MISRVDNGSTSYAKYSTFNISDSNTQYTLTVSGYSGIVLEMG